VPLRDAAAAASVAAAKTDLAAAAVTAAADTVPACLVELFVQLLVLSRMSGAVSSVCQPLPAASVHKALLPPFQHTAHLHAPLVQQPAVCVRSCASVSIRRLTIYSVMIAPI
jgi:hypothetical protein